jgi:hypothetical protein
MISIHKAAVLFVLALALLGGAAHAQCYVYPNLIANGDFENGLSSWIKTEGSFNVVENPNDSSDHEGVLYGSSAHTSTIEQSFTPMASGWHIVWLEMASAYGTCSVTATVVAGSTFTGTEEVQYNVLTYTFQIPSSVSSGKLKISVTCPGPLIQRPVRIDDVCLSQI